MITVEFGAMRPLSTEIPSEQTRSPRQSLYRIQKETSVGEWMTFLIFRIRYGSSYSSPLITHDQRRLPTTANE